MPPSYNSVSGVAAAVPSAGVPAGSGQSSQSGTGRHPALRQAILAVQAALEQIREHLANPDRSLEFQDDPGTGLVVVSVKDARTGELIRQIPGNAILRLAEALAPPDTSGPRALVDLTA